MVAIGTHALFQDGVEFHSLGLAVVDEQHRFGVAQRLALRSKGEESHTADDERDADSEDAFDELLRRSRCVRHRRAAAGKKAVVTKLIADSRRAEVVRRIREACGAGGQAYWVCPLIEEIRTAAAADGARYTRDAQPGISGTQGSG